MKYYGCWQFLGYVKIWDMIDITTRETYYFYYYYYYYYYYYIYIYIYIYINQNVRKYKIIMIPQS